MATTPKTKTKKPKPVTPRITLPKGMMFNADRQLVRKVEHSGFTIYTEVDDDELIKPMKLEDSYDGPKIVFVTTGTGTEPTVKVSKDETIKLGGWTEVKAFFKKVFDRDRSECQVTLYRSPDDSGIYAFPHQQWADTGMTANEIEGDEKTEARKAALEAAGWKEFGTIHHHCSSGAFASQTDKTDEANKPGVHITMGHMDRKVLDLDIRVRCIVPGQFAQDGEGKTIVVQKAVNEYYEKVPASFWIEYPDLSEHIRGMAPQTTANLQESMVKENIDSDDYIPEAWMESIVEKKRTPITTPGTGQRGGLVGSGSGTSAPGSSHHGSADTNFPHPCGITSAPKAPMFPDLELLTEKDHKRICEYKTLREALLSEAYEQDIPLRDIWDYFFVKVGWNPFRKELSLWDHTVVAIFKKFTAGKMGAYYDSFEKFTVPRPSAK